MRTFLLASIFLLLCSCGGGGGGGSAATPTTEIQTIHHASGRIAETGPVKAGTTIRVGEWQAFFDQDGSPKRFVGTYTEGTLDPAQPWREWNADGSIRADVSDR